LAILQWRRKPYLITGWFWYLLTLLPVIGFVQIGLQARADRYTYIPMIGVFIAMTWATADIFENIKIRRQVVTMISGSILVLLSILSFRQVSYWKNTHTLFSHALAVTRNNYLAAMILGNDYYAKRDFQKAIACYQQAISFGSYKSVAHLLHSQLATAYGVIGKYDQAITHYLLAIQANPQIAQTFFLLAELQEIKGNSSDAMANLRKALTINPDLPTANFALAQLLQKYGDDLGALTYYRAVLRNQPENPDALNAIGKHEAKQGNVSTARDYFSKALLHRPTFIDARRNLESLSSNRPDW
jgi:tetratricopeptide (TPR) repeat protein